MNNLLQHKELCKVLNKIYEKKNIEYGNSFGEIFNELGIKSATTRIGDKYYFLKSITKSSERDIELKKDLLIDTLLNLANYSIMAVIALGNTEIKK